MDRLDARTDEALSPDRWLELAQRVHAQWPEIAFDVILATRGHRNRLVDAVAETYGLDLREAERAVSIWDASRAEEPDRSDPPATRSVG